MFTILECQSGRSKRAINSLSVKSSIDFSERTEGGRIEIQGERFIVSAEFLSGRDSQAPVGQFPRSVERP